MTKPYLSEVISTRPTLKLGMHIVRLPNDAKIHLIVKNSKDIDLYIGKHESQNVNAFDMYWFDKKDLKELISALQEIEAAME